MQLFPISRCRWTLRNIGRTREIRKPRVALTTNAALDRSENVQRVPMSFSFIGLEVTSVKLTMKLELQTRCFYHVYVEIACLCPRGWDPMSRVYKREREREIHFFATKLISAILSRSFIPERARPALSLKKERIAIPSNNSASHYLHFWSSDANFSPRAELS